MTTAHEHLNRTISAYADAVGSASPTPGGGSVCATTGALATGLIEMVCRLTIRPTTAPASVEALTTTAADVAVLRQELLALAAADERAYAGFRAASALPKASDDDRTARQSAMQRALLTATQVPLETAERCLHSLELGRRASSIGTKHALSDLETATLLAVAALRGALLNVRANTDAMHDRDLASDLDARAESLRSSADLAAAGVASEIAARRAP